MKPGIQEEAIMWGATLLLQFRTTRVLPEASGASKPREVKAAQGNLWAQGFERMEKLVRGNKECVL